MKCPGCDAENMEGSDRCWQCGASFRADSREGRPKSAWVIWLAVGIGGVALVFLLFSAGNGRGGGSGSGGGASLESSATTPTSKAPASQPATPAK
jgi:hypothetical protein